MRGGWPVLHKQGAYNSRQLFSKDRGIGTRELDPRSNAEGIFSSEEQRF